MLLISIFCADYLQNICTDCTYSH